MSDKKFDNVFSAEVNKDFVSIRAGFCNEETLKKNKISDGDVEDIKEILLSPSDFKVFMNTVISAGVKLQKNHGIELGLKI